ncbi:FimV/HubP family polar landmark protein [Hylemonella gracilis]|uniref:FimV/HubP family polar landmark protein n=1 Tax=Hylemonella gracilis TaxID=80880 RepID=UPI001A952364|nr:FimV/HubP family polar landmark protein [Hylemonella gracilis]
MLQKSALALACATALGLFSAAAHALSLGRAVVQSSLGEPLRAEVELLDISNEDAASLRARLASPASFAASGMEYSPALNGLQITLQQKNGRYFLRLSNPQSVSEPYVDLILEATWASGRLVRDYTLLFDPPAGGAQAASAPESGKATDAVPEGGAPVFTPPVTTALPPPAAPIPEPAPAAEPVAPVASAAPIEPAPSDTATPATAEPVAPEPAPATSVASETPAAAATNTAAAAPPQPTPQDTVSTPPAKTAAAPTPAAAKPEPGKPGPARNTRINVKYGDTAGEIAMAQLAKQPAYVQVSLNQMLVAMLRANPNAFVNGNVNRLRTGAVLTLPGAETAQNVSHAQARQLVIAQNLDFDEYRRRLADAAPARAAAAQRQSAGNVQPQVQDRRTAATTPDQLTLSKGAVQAQNAQALAQERQARETAERSAALNKNIAELEQLSKATTPTPPGSGPAALPPGAAPTPNGAATGSVPVASAAGAAAQDAAAATPEHSPSFDELVNDLLANPVVPAVGAGLAALLIGLLVYRRRKQRPALDEYQDSMQANEGPTDAQGAPSVPAGDDVDPVAEAELYLSYGRDQQAEDILKDALPRQPLRVAIHQKLAEIYAKRGDLANFALIATQAHQASGGNGPEWDVISVLGRELDPDNALYQSGEAMSNISPDADLDFGDAAPAAAAAPATARAEAPPVDFDLSSLSLDLDGPSPSLSAATPAEDEDDPLATKLALADEFKAIGDTDGARALIEEIIAEADGEMKSRAEQALAALG